MCHYQFYIYIYGEQPHPSLPSGAVSEAPLSLLFLNTELSGLMAQRGICLFPKSHSQGEIWIEEGELDGQAALHCLLGVLGSPGLGCMGELKGKERGVVGPVWRRFSKQGGGSPAPAPPTAGRVKQRRHASRAEPAQQVPSGPPSPSEPSEAGVLLAAAVWERALGSSRQWWWLWRTPAFR